MLRPFCMLVHTGFGIVADLKETYSHSRLSAEADLSKAIVCQQSGRRSRAYFIGGMLW